jgi:hypothetical protein
MVVAHELGPPARSPPDAQGGNNVQVKDGRLSPEYETDEIISLHDFAMDAQNEQVLLSP